jgi:hypothetical protein
MRSIGSLVALFLLFPMLSSVAELASTAVAKKAEPFLLLPEPRAMRSSLSKTLAESRRTAFTPAHRTADGELSTYSQQEFTKLGISWDTFRERAETAADRILQERQPELIKDAAGHVLYGVYRGDEPIMACLLVAPSLGQYFKKVFGPEIWLITPDRNSLYVFPAKEQAIADFAADLRQRYQDSAFAASEEVFLRKSGEALKVIGILPK